ncbi:MAG: phospholipid carrier-dependent glycosyltransferase [Candidatus Schekmanbacteria bacterium]|nr:MAG: phospholipid carrier-dependent glycosyltransferase [Candidatus Schekmanbacteria bacterium]
MIYDYYVAFASLFIFTFSPLSIYYYRAFMPESLLLFFIILSLFLIIKWQKERKTIFFNLSIFSFSIALLVKILVLFLLPVFLLIIYTSNNDKQKSFKNILLFTLLSLILPVCWHLHAYLIYKETGLTFGIFSGGFLKFGTMYDWSNWGFYEKIFKRIFILLLTPFGFILFLFGIFIKEEKKENLFLYLWLILLPIVVIATSKGFYAHDYYLISFLPMFSMIAGKSIRPLIPMIKKINSKVLITLFLFVILLPLSSYYALVGDMYIKGGLYKIKWNLIEMGKFIKENSDRNSLIAIAGTPDITPLPCLFYFSERKGWYLKKDDLKTEDDLKKIKADGASIVATMEVNEFPILKNYAQKKPNKVIRKNDFLIIIINEQE